MQRIYGPWAGRLVAGLIIWTAFASVFSLLLGYSRGAIVRKIEKRRLLRVNRAVIRLGESRLLVYYFFKQRKRVLTNEYMVKWFLMWDAIARNRTDGALVRLSICAFCNLSE